MAQTGLTGEQFEQFQAAIISAYVSYNGLRPPVRYAFDLNLNTIVTEAAPLNSQVHQLIEWAEANGQVAELVRALRRPPPTGNPGNPKLAAFAKSYLGSDDKELDRVVDGIIARNPDGFPVAAGWRDKLKTVAEALGGSPKGLEEHLEKLVRRNPSAFNDPAAWRQAMVRAESVVCRIESPDGTPVGTGFLVGPDLVLTNQHVREQAGFDERPADARFRFGYRVREDLTTDGGTLHELAKNWHVHHSVVDKLDYALVQLSAKAGDEPIGSYQNAPERAWLTAGANQPLVDQSLFVIQHPKGDTLKVAEGTLRVNANGWMDYDVNTDKGSSGSPVLDNQWELVGLHSREGAGEVNRGVSILAIRGDLPDEVKNLLKPRHAK
jgi:V8-like Glu-specific endopeptidase